MDFLLAKDDLHRCRFDDHPAPEAGAGEALLRIDAFGLTSNNITYATFGEAMSYWSFFPAEHGWGRMPVWGFAEVLTSSVAELEAGTRVYGYLPPASELLVTPSRVSAHGFVDVAAHRAPLPPAYNRYARVDGDAMYDALREDEQMLLRPLFLTSYLIDDFLADGDFFAADTVVLSSASSKTASALAFLLAQRERHRRRRPDLREERRVRAHARGLWPRRRLRRARVAAGRARGVRRHGRRRSGARRCSQPLPRAARPLGGRRRHASRPHGSRARLAARPAADFLLRPRSSRQAIRGVGRGGLERRMADAWQPYVQWTAGWLKVIHGRGADALRAPTSICSTVASTRRAHTFSRFRAETNAPQALVARFGEPHLGYCAAHGRELTGGGRCEGLREQPWGTRA